MTPTPNCAQCQNLLKVCKWENNWYSLSYYISMSEHISKYIIYIFSWGPKSLAEPLPTTVWLSAETDSASHLPPHAKPPFQRGILWASKNFNYKGPSSPQCPPNFSTASETWCHRSYSSLHGAEEQNSTHLSLCSLVHCSKRRKLWTLPVYERGPWRH